MLLLSLFLACSGEPPAKDTTPKVENSEPKDKASSKKKDTSKEHLGHDAGHISSDTSGEVKDPGPIVNNAKVFFVSPKEGDILKSPITVKMGVKGMKVQKAGQVVPETGHHHIIIDADSVKKGKTVPADDQHKHFGKGQTETSLELAPGEHTLRLQFANGAHISYGVKLEAAIKITITE